MAHEKFYVGFLCGGDLAILVKAANGNALLERRTFDEVQLKCIKHMHFETLQM